MNTVYTLLSSRKFWAGTLSVVAVAAAVTLRHLGLIDADALIPTISSITALGLGFIGATAHEDAASKKGE